MEEICSRFEPIDRKIKAADIDPLPSDNIYMEQIFEPTVYAEILAKLPVIMFTTS